MSALDDAKAQSDAAKKAALEAIANAQSSGQAAINQQTAQLQSQQQAALQLAAQNAALRGASSAAQAEIGNIVRMPGDSALANLATDRGAFDVWMAQQQGANASYFDQAAAAIPVIQARAAQVAGGGGGGGGGSGGSGGGRYGGYGSSGEYENAVAALAGQLRDEQAGQAAQAEADAKSRSTSAAAFRAADEASSAGTPYHNVYPTSGGTQPPSAADYRQEAQAPHNVAPRPQMPNSLAITQAVGGGQDWFGNWPANQPAIDWGPSWVGRQPGDQSVAPVDPSHQSVIEQMMQTVRDSSKMQNAWNDAGQATLDPQNFYQWALDAAINKMGADPYDALGRFTPGWGIDRATADMTAQNDYWDQASEEQFRAANGGLSRTEVAGRIDLERKLQPGTTIDRMGVAGVDTPDQLAQFEGSQEYSGAVGVAQALLQGVDPETGGQLQHPATLDDLKSWLNSLNLPGPVIDLVLHDYSGRFTSSSYIPQTGPYAGG